MHWLTTATSRGHEQEQDTTAQLMCCKLAPYFTTCCNNRQLLDMKGIKAARPALGSGFHAEQSPSEGRVDCGMKATGQAELRYAVVWGRGAWCKTKTNLLPKTTMQLTMQYYELLKSLSLVMSSPPSAFSSPGPCYNLPLSLWEPCGDSGDWELQLYGTILIAELRIPLGFPICFCGHIPV